jgi:protein-S-isoprenylcysteine O-methyltransferase Ste14
MGLVENKVKPYVVALLCGGAMWLLAKQTPTVGIPSNARVGAAILILAVGLLVMLAGVISFRHAKTTVNPLKPETATALVTSGIYRYTRNPMYLGMLMVLLAWAVYLASPAALLGVLAFWAFIGHFQIRTEENALAGLFGSAFMDYMSRVRRWL